MRNFGVETMSSSLESRSSVGGQCGHSGVLTWESLLSVAICWSSGWSFLGFFGFSGLGGEDASGQEEKGNLRKERDFFDECNR